MKYNFTIEIYMQQGTKYMQLKVAHAKKLDEIQVGLKRLYYRDIHAAGHQKIKQKVAHAKKVARKGDPCKKKHSAR